MYVVLDSFWRMFVRLLKMLRKPKIEQQKMKDKKIIALS
jgi:hypothetical protein